MNNNLNKLRQVEPLEKAVDHTALSTAMTAYLNVWNMVCPHCGMGRSGLLQRDGVLIVDVFYQQGIAAVTYDPERVPIDDLLRAVTMIGQDTCCYYGAEFIGHGPTPHS
jgi:copper chaperone CopZ